jgi:hypothetical protein
LDGIPSSFCPLDFNGPANGLRVRRVQRHHRFATDISNIRTGDFIEFRAVARPTYFETRLLTFGALRQCPGIALN